MTSSPSSRDLDLASLLLGLPVLTALAGGVVALLRPAAALSSLTGASTAALLAAEALGIVGGLVLARRLHGSRPVLAGALLMLLGVLAFPFGSLGWVVANDAELLPGWLGVLLLPLAASVVALGLRTVSTRVDTLPPVRREVSTSRPPTLALAAGVAMLLTATFAGQVSDGAGDGELAYGFAALFLLLGGLPATALGGVALLLHRRPLPSVVLTVCAGLVVTLLAPLGLAALADGSTVLTPVAGGLGVALGVGVVVVAIHGFVATSRREASVARR